MKILQRFLICILMLLIVINGLNPWSLKVKADVQPPTIQKVESTLIDGTLTTPAKGTKDGGTVIKISGSGFGTRADTEVYIGDIGPLNKATVLSANSSEIIAKTPPLWDMSLLNTALPVIVLRTSDGQSGAIPNGFTYVDNPTIDKVGLNTEITFIKDSLGNVIGRTTATNIRISGRNYGGNVAEVWVSGERAQILKQTDSVLVVKVPDTLILEPGRTYDVTVKSKYGGSALWSGTLPPVTHDITSISDSEVIVGQEITINGHGFEPDMKVYTGDNLATITGTVYENQVKVLVAAPKDNTLEYQNIDIELSNGATVTLKDALKIYPTPVQFNVLSITPNAGPVTGGTKIYIVGTGLEDNMVIEIGGRKATGVKKVYPKDAPPGTTVLEAITPPSDTQGPKDVVITNPIDKSSKTILNGFFYLLVSDALVVVDINPPREGYETGGDNIDIYGRNFQKSDDLYIAGLGTDEVTLTTDPYDYYDPISQTTKQVIRERKLFVTMGGQKAKINEILTDAGTGNQTIRAVTPAVTLDPRIKTPVDVVVTVTTTIKDASTGDIIMEYVETAYSPNKFTYKPVPSDPEIVQVTLADGTYPAKGSVAGGTQIIIIGADFRDNPDVYIGGNKATVLKVENLPGQINGKPKTQIIALTPPSSVRGLVDVTVKNKDNDGVKGIATLKNAFEYITNPFIISVIPSVSSKYGGLYITVTGRDFLVTQSVYGEVYKPVINIGGIDVTVLSVLDDKGNVLDGKKYTIGTKIKAYIPPNPSGYVPGFKDMTLKNPDDGYTEAKNIIEFKDTKVIPVITEVKPSRGNVKGGTEVTITGGNFKSQLMVTIDGEPAQVLSVSKGGTEIKIKTPPGTIGKKPVQVINLDDGGTATLEDGFEYVKVETNPVIKNIVPNHGGKGTLVVITGSDFAKKATGQDENGNPIIIPQSKVYFGDTLVDEVYTEVVDDKTIKVMVPDLVKPGLYDVKVENPDTATAVSPAKFKFQVSDSHPVINSVTPSRGSINGGTIITIEGSDFRKNAEVYIGGNPATDVSVSEDGTRIIAKTPSGKEGPQDVTVVNYDGGSYTLYNGFQYVIPYSEPKIERLEPKEGTTAGGDVVYVYGFDFRVQKDDQGNIILDQNGNPIPPEVYFGTVKAQSVKWISYEKLEVITPPNLPGPCDVTVVNYDTGTYTLKNGFNYKQSKPTITKVIPPKLSKNGGTKFYIIGTNFAVKKLDNNGNAVNPGASVKIDGILLTDVSVIDETFIIATAPAVSSIGMKEVLVINPDGGTAKTTMEFVSPNSNPRIDTVSPNKGTLKGGTVVTITGSDFRDRVKVWVGIKEAEVISAAPTVIKIRTPEGSMSDLGKKLNIMVFNEDDGGSAVKENAFEYVLAESNPKITSITPNVGSTAGGDRIVIKGDDFRTGAQVYIDGVPATGINVIDYKTIEAITPPGQEGKKDVTVRNPDYGEYTLKEGFTYIFTKPEAPSGFWAQSLSGSTIRLYWTEGKGAAYYELYGKPSGSSEYRFIASTQGLEYYVTGLSSSTGYDFRMRAVNKYGVSNFLYAYARTSSTSEDEDMIDETQKTRISLNKGSVEVLVGTEDVSSSSYKLNLNTPEYQKAENINIILPGTVIKNVSKDIYVDMGSMIASLSPRSLYSYPITKLDETDLKKASGRFSVRKVSGSEKDRIYKYLQRGSKVISDIIEVRAEVFDGSKTTALDYLNGYAYFSLLLRDDTIRNLDKTKLAVYYYEPVTDRWVFYGGYFDPYTAKMSFTTGKAGRYVVLYVP